MEAEAEAACKVWEECPLSPPELKRSLAQMRHIDADPLVAGPLVAELLMELPLKKSKGEEAPLIVVSKAADKSSTSKACISSLRQLSPSRASDRLASPR